MIEVVDNELQDCETSALFKFKLDIGVPDAILNYLSDGWINYMSIMDLISTFDDTIVDHAYIIECLLTRVNNFI